MRESVYPLLSCLLLGCASAPAVEPAPMAQAALPSTPITLDRAQTQAVQAAVRATLKDPDSARFERIIASRNATGRIAVCGFVNAKNSYGGYTGMTPFNGEFTGAVFTPDLIGTTEDFIVRAIRERCARQGLIL